jgi:hypothetical protein
VQDIGESGHVIGKGIKIKDTLPVVMLSEEDMDKEDVPVQV